MIALDICECWTVDQIDQTEYTDIESSIHSCTVRMIILYAHSSVALPPRKAENDTESPTSEIPESGFPMSGIQESVCRKVGTSGIG